MAVYFFALETHKPKKDGGVLRSNLAWSTNYLRDHNYKRLSNLKYLKKYAIGTEIAIVYTYGTYTRYEYF
jgi:hypothetical protein